MPASNATASGLASRYATALFELALERNAVDQVEGDLDGLARAHDENPDLARLIRTPIVSREEQRRAMEALAERLGLSELVRSFLGVLASQRRLAVLPAVIAEFKRRLALHRGEETAEVVSAVPLEARAFIEFLASPEARRAWLAANLEPLHDH